MIFVDLAFATNSPSFVKRKANIWNLFRVRAFVSLLWQKTPHYVNCFALWLRLCKKCQNLLFEQGIAIDFFPCFAHRPASIYQTVKQHSRPRRTHWSAAYNQLRPLQSQSQPVLLPSPPTQSTPPCAAKVAAGSGQTDPRESREAAKWLPLLPRRNPPPHTQCRLQISVISFQFSFSGFRFMFFGSTINDRSSKNESYSGDMVSSRVRAQTYSAAGSRKSRTSILKCSTWKYWP